MIKTAYLRSETVAYYVVSCQYSIVKGGHCMLLMVFWLAVRWWNCGGISDVLSTLTYCERDHICSSLTRCLFLDMSFKARAYNLFISWITWYMIFYLGCFYLKLKPLRQVISQGKSCLLLPSSSKRKSLWFFAWHTLWHFVKEYILHIYLHFVYDMF